MEPQNHHFNHNLLLVVTVLYVLTIAIFAHPMAVEPESAQWWKIPVNLLIISIPLMLPYGSIHGLVRVWHERSTVGEVSPLLFLVFAWKRPAISFVVVLIAGIAFAVFFVRDLYALPDLLRFVFPILLIASLFYADWKWLNPPGIARSLKSLRRTYHMITTEQPISKQHRSLQGVLSFLLAVATAGSVTMIGFTSFTPFNPPDWLRIATMAPLPFVIILSVGFGLTGIKRNSGRVWAITGLVLTALSVVAFVVMLNIGE